MDIHKRLRSLSISANFEEREEDSTGSIISEIPENVELNDFRINLGKNV